MRYITYAYGMIYELHFKYTETFVREQIKMGSENERKLNK